LRGNQNCHRERIVSPPLDIPAPAIFGLNAEGRYGNKFLGLLPKQGTQLKISIPGLAVKAREPLRF
jgi:hypothetical protein